MGNAIACIRNAWDWLTSKNPSRQEDLEMQPLNEWQNFDVSESFAMDMEDMDPDGIFEMSPAGQRDYNYIL